MRPLSSAQNVWATHQECLCLPLRQTQCCSTRVGSHRQSYLLLGAQAGHGTGIRPFSGLVELPPAVDASLVFQVVPGAPRARLLVACKIQGVSYVALFIGLCPLHEDSSHTWIHCQKMFKKCERFVGVPLPLDVQRSVTKSHLPRFASIACGRANFAVTNRGVVHSWAGTQESWHVLPWFSLLPESLVDLSFGCLPFLAGVRPAFNFCSFILRIYFWHVLVVACHRLCQPSFD